MLLNKVYRTLCILGVLGLLACPFTFAQDVEVSTGTDAAVEPSPDVSVSTGTESGIEGPGSTTIPEERGAGTGEATPDSGTSPTESGDME